MIAMHRRFPEGGFSPSLMTATYFVILGFVVLSVALQIAGFEISAGLAGAFTVFLIALTALAQVIIWALRTAS